MGLEVKKFEWTPNGLMMIVMFVLTLMSWYYGVRVLYNYRKLIPDIIEIILFVIILSASPYLIWSFFDWLFKMIYGNKGQDDI